jgi:hypothetical protein
VGVGGERGGGSRCLSRLLTRSWQLMEEWSIAVSITRHIVPCPDTPLPSPPPFHPPPPPPPPLPPLQLGYRLAHILKRLWHISLDLLQRDGLALGGAGRYLGRLAEAYDAFLVQVGQP